MRLKKDKCTLVRTYLYYMYSIICSTSNTCLLKSWMYQSLCKKAVLKIRFIVQINIPFDSSLLAMSMPNVATYFNSCPHCKKYNVRPSASGVRCISDVNKTPHKNSWDVWRRPKINGRAFRKQSSSSTESRFSGLERQL